MLVKKTKRREWTAEDVRELKQLAKAKTPAAQIARKLKRTEGATRQKALTLEVSLNSRAARPKTAGSKTAGKKTAGKRAASKKAALKKGAGKKTGLKKTAAKKTALKKQM